MYLHVPVLIAHSKTSGWLPMNQQMMTWPAGKVFHHSCLPVVGSHLPFSWQQHNTTITAKISMIITDKIIKIILSLNSTNHDGIHYSISLGLSDVILAKNVEEKRTFVFYVVFSSNWNYVIYVKVLSILIKIHFGEILLLMLMTGG